MSYLFLSLQFKFLIVTIRIGELERVSGVMTIIELQAYSGNFSLIFNVNRSRTDSIVKLSFQDDLEVGSDLSGGRAVTLFSLTGLASGYAVDGLLSEIIFDFGNSSAKVERNRQENGSKSISHEGYC